MTRTIHLARATAIALALSALGGCASGGTRYACPAPDGVTCMSARDVYEATDTTDRVAGRPRTQSKLQATDQPVEYGAPSRRPQGPRDSVVIDQGALAFETTMNPSGGLDLGAPVTASPVRTPPKVMRVWVNAWEDESGDLHSAASVYTEIQPRRWSVGEPAGSAGPQLRLIQPLNTAGTNESQRAALTRPVDVPPVSADRGGIQ